MLLVSVMVPVLDQAPLSVSVPPPLTEIRPLLDHDPAKVRLAPLTAWIEPALLQPTALIVRVPEVSAKMVPWFTTLILVGPPTFGL